MKLQADEIISTLGQSIPRRPIATPAALACPACGCTRAHRNTASCYACDTAMEPSLPNGIAPVVLQDLTAGGLDDADAPELPDAVRLPDGTLVCPDCGCSWTRTNDPDPRFRCYDCGAVMVPGSRVGSSVPVHHSTDADRKWPASLTPSMAAELEETARKAREGAWRAVQLADLCTPSEALQLLSHAYSLQRQRALRLHDNESASALDYAVRGIETAACELEAR